MFRWLKGRDWYAGYVTGLFCLYLLGIVYCIAHGIVALVRWCCE